MGRADLGGELGLDELLDRRRQDLCDRRRQRRVRARQSLTEFRQGRLVVGHRAIPLSCLVTSENRTVATHTPVTYQGQTAALHHVTGLTRIG